MIPSRCAAMRLRRFGLPEQHRPSFFLARLFGSFEGNPTSGGDERPSGAEQIPPTRSRPRVSRNPPRNLARGDWKTIEYQGAAAHGSNFQRFVAFVDELEIPTNDNTPSPISLPPPTLLNEALSYFTSYSAGAYASKENMPDVPKQYAKKLLNYLEHQYRTNPEQATGAWIQNCVGNKGSPCFCLVSAMNFFMRPLKGTSASLRAFGQRKQRRSDMRVEELSEALKDASRAHRFITELMEDTSCPAVALDWNIFLIVLELWKSRCWYLGAHWNRKHVTPDFCQDAFEGVESAQECIDVMAQYIEQMESKFSPHQRESTYTMFLGALANSGIPGAANQALDVLQKLEEKHLPRQSHIYNSAMLACANEAKYNPAAVHKARELWSHILAISDRIKPDAVSATTLLTAYSNAQMPEEVEKLIISYEESSASTGIRPSRIDYNIGVNAWAKTTNPQASQRALALFRRMLELSQSGTNPNASPDTITYSVLIDSFARNPNTGSEGLDHAEYLLQHAESGDDPNVQPDAIMYRNYMSALSMRLGTQKRNYAKAAIAIRIESLVHRMRTKSRSVPESAKALWHNTSIYGIAISAWSKTKSAEAPKRGFQLFQEMKRESRQQRGLRPDLQVYNSLLTCLGTRIKVGSKCFDENTAVRTVNIAQEVMREMKQDGFDLTIDTMNLYFKVLISSGIAQAVQEAEKTIESLEEACAAGQAQVVPNSFSYQIVMEGYSKVPGGAEHAERTLHKIISLAGTRESLTLNSALFNIAMDAWSRSRREDAVEQAARIMAEGEKHGFQPTIYSYTTLINALAYCGRDDAPEAAESLLGQMQSDFESGKNPHCKPTDAPFSAVIKCWLQSGKPEAPDRIDAIVQRLKDLSDHEGYDNMDLNYSSLKCAILAWMKFTDSRPDAGDRATKYLDLVDECFQAGKLEAYSGLHCYNAVLVTIARSRDGDKAGKAYSILKRMERAHYSRARDYRAVLSACNETGTLTEATDLQKEEAFRIANVTFLEYKESKMKPFIDVYNEMIRVHTTLLDGDESQQEREMLISAIILNSPKEIQQSPKVRAAMRPAMSKEMYDDTTKKSDATQASQA